MDCQLLLLLMQPLQILSARIIERQGVRKPLSMVGSAGHLRGAAFVAYTPVGNIRVVLARTYTRFSTYAPQASAALSV